MQIAVIALAGLIGLAGGGCFLFGDDEPEPKKKTVLMVEECEIPRPPAVPDGREATEQQMRQAQNAVRVYVALGQEYIDCMNDLEALLVQDGPSEKLDQTRVKRDRMFDAMQATANRFNAQLRVFRQREDSAAD